MTFLTRQTIIVVSRKIEYDLRNDFLAHIQKLPLSYFQNTPTGDLMAHATNDISAVRNALGPGIMYPSDTFMTFSMALTLMFVKDWSLTLVALVPLPLISYAVYKLGKIIHAKFNERQEQYSLLTTRAQENLSGIRVVKAYVREEYEIGLFEKLSWVYLKKNLVLAKAQSIMWPMMYMLVGYLACHHGILRRTAGHRGENFHWDVDGVLHLSLDADMADDRIRLGDEYHSARRGVDGEACENLRYGTGDPRYGRDRYLDQTYRRRDRI